MNADDAETHSLARHPLFWLTCYPSYTRFYAELFGVVTSSHVTKMAVTSIIRSAIGLSEHSKTHAKLTALSSTEPDLLPSKVLHYRNREFRVLCSCDLDLDLMTFIYELDPYPMKIFLHTKNKLPTSRLSKFIVITAIIRHTDTRNHRKH